MVQDPIAVVARRDYTARHPIFTQHGVIDRSEVSPASEGQTVRAQATL
jgi:hypothetical protein